MNKKCAIFSIVLIALMFGFLLPHVAYGFGSGYPPNGVNNAAWNEYGPSITALWIHDYGSYSAEVTAMEAKTGASDFMDDILVPSDEATMASLNRINQTAVTELGVDGLDWNDAFLPMNNTYYRQGVSEILQVDKVNWVSTWLGSGGAACYSPIPGDIYPTSGYPWYDPNTQTIFAGGYSQGLTDLLSSGIPLAVDKSPSAPSGTVTWNFTAPFPKTSGVSYNPLIGGSLAAATGGVGYDYMPNGANGGIICLTRTTDQRIDLGPEVQKMLGANFTWWYQNVAPTQDPSGVTAFKAALASAGLSTSLLPRIDVTVILGTMDQFAVPVFYDYCYELYTGGYSYGFTPDSFLFGLANGNAPQSFGWYAPEKDDCAFYDNYYTGLETFMENSTTVGNPLVSPLSQPGTAMYYCWEAQMYLMGQAADDMYWVSTGNSPVNAGDLQAVYAAGTGFDNWYSFLDTYTTSASPQAAGPGTVTFGLRSSCICECNPISSYTIYDDFVWSEIYDTLAISNASQLDQILPYIATSWRLGTWTNTGSENIGQSYAPISPGKTSTNMTVVMASNVEWQDVPGPENRAPYTLDNDSLLNGPLTDRYVTPLDFAFTCAYCAMGVGFTAFYNSGWCEQIDHVVVSNSWLTQFETANPFGAVGVGYPWANETYINLFMGINSTDSGVTSIPAWPAFQLFTPGVPGYPGYYTTHDYEANLVQFSPSLNSSTIEVYMSALEPWLAPYRILEGIPILPMSIFSHLAEAAWPTKDIQGKPWTTTDVTLIDMEPWSLSGKGGADIEYGSGPFILVDDAGDTPGITYRLDPYVQGLTYGPGLTFAGAPTVTLDHSYFLYKGSAIVVSAVPGTATASTSSAPSIDPGPKILVGESLKDINSSQVGSVNVPYTWVYRVFDISGNLISTGTAAGGTASLSYGGTAACSGILGPINQYADPFHVDYAIAYSYLGRNFTTPFASYTTDYHQGLVGVTGEKLVFAENLTNTNAVAEGIDYYWNYSVMAYNFTTGTFNIKVTSGSTTPVLTSVAATTTSTVYNVIRLCPTYLSPVSTGASPLWNESFIVKYGFNWNSTYYISFGTTELNFHPADIAYAGAPALPGYPWMGGQAAAGDNYGSVAGTSFHILSVNWLSPANNPNPDSNVDRADIAGSGSVSGTDLHVIALEWTLPWSLYP